jgi:putative membrane protein
MRFTLIISLLLAILAVVFALQNPQQATVDLFTTTFQGSTALILIVTFAIGVLVGILGAIPGWLRNRRKVSSLQKTIAEREDQVRRERETTREETTTRETTSPSETERRTPPPSESSEGAGSSSTTTTEESETRSSSSSSSGQSSSSA